MGSGVKGASTAQRQAKKPKPRRMRLNPSVGVGWGNDMAAMVMEAKIVSSS
jgi:hypothetical protein